MPYVTKGQQLGFKTNYKYSCIDNSPLSVYITKPLWIWTSNFIPLWVAPNTLTLTGFFFTILQFLLLTFYDADFTAGQSIPSYIWYVCALFQYFSYMLDGVDGIQARKTKTSSPLGELMDHGIDSWTCCFTIMSLFSCIGYSTDPDKGLTFNDMFIMTWLLQFVFYSAHWEKLVTGTLYLPWTYDLGVCSIIILYIITGVFGSTFWTFPVPIFSVPFIILVKKIFYATSVISLLFDIYKVGKKYFQLRISSKNSKHSTDPANKTQQTQVKERRRPLKEILAPWVSMVLGSFLLWTWLQTSTLTVISACPRAILLASGSLFANILCRILLYQMSRTEPTHVINPGIYVLFLFYLVDRYAYTSSLLLWQMAAGVIIFLHLHFGASVIKILSDCFNIFPFSVQKRTIIKKNL